MVDRTEMRKIKLELRLIPRVRRLINKSAASMAISYELTGQPGNDPELQEELRSLLLDHYQRIGRSFLRDIRANPDIAKEANIPPEIIEQSDTERLAALIALSWIIDIESRAPTQAGIIAQTTRDQFAREVEKANQAILEDGRAPDRKEVGEVAKRQVGKTSLNRAKSIATFETQSAAESAKFIEFSALSGEAVIDGADLPSAVPLAVLASVSQVKDWVTRRDEKVRPSHVAVDGRTVASDDFFSVGGASLRYPGDTLLNPPLGEVINCRCRARYRLEQRITN